MRLRRSTMLAGAAMMAGAILVHPAPAFAAVDDSIATCTDDGLLGGCNGRVRFVDHGPGKPGGGDNDDYIVCEDNSSEYVIGCWLWHNGDYRGGVLSSDDNAVVWEPSARWNVKGGEKVRIKVCLQRLPIEPEGWGDCTEKTRKSVDG
jgi:hypothetical protein